MNFMKFADSDSGSDSVAAKYKPYSASFLCTASSSFSTVLGAFGYG